MEKGNWQNKRMGGMAMGKCKYGQKESFHNETNCERFQEWCGGLQFGIVYTCNGFLQRTCEFKEVDYKTFFHKLIE